MEARNNITVIALGGNALLQRGEKGSFEEQYSNAKRTAEKIANLVEKGTMLVITHGNGPQVGATLLRHDAGMKVYSVPAFPMDACGAETQGLIGYMIQQALNNEFIKRGLSRRAVTLVTRVLVDAADRAFQNPSKPIGPFYTKEQAELFMKERPGMIFKEDAGRGYRRFVPSPEPIEILEAEPILKLVELGYVVICSGGGGIPVVVKKSNGKAEHSGVEAVIDKDLAAERLASLLKAERLAILTDVDSVYLNYGKSGQKELRLVKAGELERYLAEGHFAEGSMGPKVKAAIRFVKNGGREAIIGNLYKLEEVFEGRSGTKVLP